MGTTYHVTIVPGDMPVDVAALKAEVDRRLAEINQSMSTYIDDSELNRLNRAPVNAWIEVSERLHEVLLLALEIGWLSGGAFDVTVGPLVDLWGFGPQERTGALPSREALERARERVGFQYLEIDLDGGRVRRRRPVQIDLSAIAKGYAVDEVAELLARRGHDSFMVEIGGELRVSGRSPRGGLWRIGVEKPDALPGDVQLPIAVTDAAIATSGDYRNYFVNAGERYSHTIDPTTGRPVRHALASVTVVADTAALADALATALEVLGPERALRLAEQQGLAVYLIARDGEKFKAEQSAAFARYREQAQASR